MPRIKSLLAHGQVRIEEPEEDHARKVKDQTSDGTVDPVGNHAMAAESWNRIIGGSRERIGSGGTERGRIAHQ